MFHVQVWLSMFTTAQRRKPYSENSIILKRQCITNDTRIFEKLTNNISFQESSNQFKQVNSYGNDLKLILLLSNYTINLWKSKGLFI